MSVTNNITLFSDTATDYFNATELAQPTNTTHTGAVLNNRLNYKSYNSFAKTVSTICAGLAEFLANYGGIASGTMDVDTDLMTWTNYMQALTTDNKMANAQNAVTPLAISGTTTNTKSTTGHTHSLAMGVIAGGNQNPISGGTAFTYINPYFSNTNNIQNSAGGFSAGASASSTAGGAIGENSVATTGGAVGQGATSSTGGAVGYNASAGYGGAVGAGAATTEGGGAIGNVAKTNRGGAVGNGSNSTNGFAGGDNAKATANNAVQLGTGTNNTANTMQFLDKQVLATNFSQLTPSTSNGWTQANQDTNLNVADGLYLIQTSDSAPAIVPIIANSFSVNLSPAPSTVSTPALIFYSFRSFSGQYLLLTCTFANNGSANIISKTSFTYYYKKLV